MEIQLTQWNKHGDHPLVTEEACTEFEYIESKKEGCGFINLFTIVRPGNYILEINDVYVAVVSEVKAKAILGVKPEEKIPTIIRRTGKSK